MFALSAIGIVLTLALYLLMYSAFRPFTNALAIRILLAVLSFGVLAGLVVTATQQAPAAQIIPNFLKASAGILVTFPVFHFAEKWLSRSRPG